ncbi:MAG: hypothetical protein KKC18_17065 [Chloroflexi bacterium]|nr:hypothetical protein [Chloroflexota bacterium]
MTEDRQRQRRRFIWFRGVIGFGLPAGVIYAAMYPLIWEGQSGYINQMLLGLRFLPLWAIGGYVWGMFMWNQLPSKAKEKDGEDQA